MDECSTGDRSAGLVQDGPITDEIPPPRRKMYVDVLGGQHDELLKQENASRRQRALLRDAMTALRLGEPESVVRVKLAESVLFEAGG